MNDASINIALRLVDQATAPMRHAMGEIERQTRVINTALKATAGLFAGFLGAGAVGQVVQIADSMSLLHSRLNLVGGDMEEIAKIANATYQNLDATVTVYARLARATQDYGISQQDLLDVTKALNDAVRVSGATSEEAAAALIQLSQGLASGALRGDELRSILEQLPEVGRMIAQGMGVAYGSLRELGKEGKLTTDEVVQAILKMKDSIAAQAGTMETTVSQSIMQLSNVYDIALDKINRMEEGTSTLADTILWLSSVVNKVPQAWAGFKAALAYVDLQFAELTKDVDEFVKRYNELIVTVNNNPFGDWVISDDSAESAKSAIKALEKAIAADEQDLKRRQEIYEKYKRLFENGVPYEAPVRKTISGHGGTPHPNSNLHGSSQLSASQISALLSQAEKLKQTFALSGMDDESRAYARIDAQYDHYWRKIEELAKKAPEKFREMFSSIDDARKMWAEAWNNETDEAIERFNQVADAGSDAFVVISEDLYNQSQYLTDMWTNAMQGMSDASKTFFVDAMDGNFKDLGASFENMVKQMVSQWLAAQVQMALFGNVPGELGGLLGAGIDAISQWWNPSSPVYGDQATMLYTGWRHDGGVVGESAPSKAAYMPAALFAGAPRLHSGLMPDEFPAILQKGETVLPKGVSAGSPVTVNVYEAPGTQAKVQQRDDGNGGLTLDVIISQVEDKLSANVAMGRGSLAPVLQSTYGLNRTAGSYR